jgi:hypothetical protein
MGYGIPHPEFHITNDNKFLAKKTKILAVI